MDEFEYAIQTRYRNDDGTTTGWREGTPFDAPPWDYLKRSQETSIIGEHRMVRRPKPQPWEPYTSDAERTIEALRS